MTFLSGRTEWSKWQSLPELSHRPYIIPLANNVNDQNWNQRYQEIDVQNNDGHNGHQQGESEASLLQIAIGYLILDGFNVLAEAVHDAADGRRLEEPHAGAEDRVEHRLVEVAGGSPDQCRKQEVREGLQHVYVLKDAGVSDIEKGWRWGL